VPTGRITGTVIDLTSGAPVPGIGVAVGDVVVTSDANGNYDRTGLTPGRYMVALTLTANQGIAAQEPIAVDLDAGATRVQHLFFRSQPVVSAAPASATATPAELPRTGRTAPGEWRWMWLGIVVIMLGAAIRIGAAGRHSAKP
jgi:hypothetical protein